MQGATFPQAWRSRRNRSSPSPARTRAQTGRFEATSGNADVVVEVSRVSCTSRVRSGATSGGSWSFRRCRRRRRRGRKTSTHVRREGLGEEGVVHTNVSRGPVGRYRLGGDHARAAGVERGSDEGVAVEGCAREREEPPAGAEERGSVPTLPADEDRQVRRQSPRRARRRRTPPRRRRPRSTAERRGASPSTRGAHCETPARTRAETAANAAGTRRDIGASGSRAFELEGRGWRNAERAAAPNHRGPPCEAVR